MKSPDLASQATFRIVEQPNGSFGVSVEIPESNPTMVTSFATKSAAEVWIANYKTRIEAGPPAKRWARGFSRSKA